jgi:hypothetical protein
MYTKPTPKVNIPAPPSSSSATSTGGTACTRRLELRADKAVTSATSSSATARLSIQINA